MPGLASGRPGELPGVPAVPAAQAGIPAAPGGTTDGDGFVPGPGPGGTGTAAAAALLLAALALVLGCARRRHAADAPWTSAILCPDEVPG